MKLHCSHEEIEGFFAGGLFDRILDIAREPASQTGLESIAEEEVPESLRDFMDLGRMVYLENAGEARKEGSEEIYKEAGTTREDSDYVVVKTVQTPRGTKREYKAVRVREGTVVSSRRVSQSMQGGTNRVSNKLYLELNLATDTRLTGYGQVFRQGIEMGERESAWIEKEICFEEMAGNLQLEHKFTGYSWVYIKGAIKGELKKGEATYTRAIVRRGYEERDKKVRREITRAGGIFGAPVVHLLPS